MLFGIVNVITNALAHKELARASEYEKVKVNMHYLRRQHQLHRNLAKVEDQMQRKRNRNKEQEDWRKQTNSTFGLRGEAKRTEMLMKKGLVFVWWTCLSISSYL